MSKGALSDCRCQPAEGTTSRRVERAGLTELPAFRGATVSGLHAPMPPSQAAQASYYEQDREHAPKSHIVPSIGIKPSSSTPSRTSDTTWPWAGYLAYESSVVEKWEIWAGAGRSKINSEKINEFLKAAGSNILSLLEK